MRKSRQATRFDLRRHPARRVESGRGGDRPMSSARERPATNGCRPRYRDGMGAAAAAAGVQQQLVSGGPVGRRKLTTQRLRNLLIAAAEITRAQ